MDPRSAYRLQVMEKLGAPLLASLPPGMDGEKTAETVAALIAKAVQAGLALASAMKLSDTDGDIDSIRLSLAAIAAPLLAQSFKDTGKLPDEAAVEQLVKGLEAALVFSENFTPAQEHTARLKSLHNPLPVIDVTQTGLLALNALSPAVMSLQQFSFGQSAPALIKDVGARLQGAAKDIAKAQIPDDNEGDQAFAQLMVLRALADNFAAAHRQVVQDHSGEAAPSLDAVWAAFDEQVAMLAALAGAAVPDVQQSGGSGGGKAPEVQQNEASAAANPMGFFKKDGAAPDASGAEPPASSPPASSSGSPMSFFKKGG